MKFTFDPNKNRVNLVKHGISLSDVRLMDWEDALRWVDDRKEYGELRWVALAPINERLYCVVYVDLKQNRRVISLRKANIREIDKYEKEIN
jgi:hypothetical protein